MSDLNTLIDEAMASCARLNAQLSVIAAKVAMRESEPEFRYFREDTVIWKASENSIAFRINGNTEWSKESMLTLHDLTSTNTPEITALEGEPS